MLLLGKMRLPLNWGGSLLLARLGLHNAYRGTFAHSPNGDIKNLGAAF